MIVIIELCSLNAETDVSQNVNITSCLLSNVVHVLPDHPWPSAVALPVMNTRSCTACNLQSECDRGKCTRRSNCLHHCGAAAASAAAAAAPVPVGSAPLILYDISSPLQPRAYAPNPSKARLALSFKAVPFTTTWVDILDIPDVRKGLNCAAVRKFDDGSEYYTLPMLQVWLIAMHAGPAWQAFRMMLPYSLTSRAGTTRVARGVHCSLDGLLVSPVTANAREARSSHCYCYCHML